MLRELPLECIAKDYYFEISMLVELGIVQATTCDVPMPAIYGPAGDVKWAEADPTYSLEAAKRGG